jgi:hypothetical protein
MSFYKMYHQQVMPLQLLMIHYNITKKEWISPLDWYYNEFEDAIPFVFEEE